MKLSPSQETKVKRFIPKHSGSSAFWWVLQRVSGFLVFLFVFFHMVVNHYLTLWPGMESRPELEDGIASFSAVQWKMQNPLYFWISILFVVFLMLHMLNGFRMVVLDVATGHSFRKIFGILLLLIGVLAVIYAFTLNSTILSLG
ncbi:hypothetical protein CEE45_14580 [Candidatus Heimdallarchaeota archaeon B3_Heim]|nr:MAG: hypothetical protein CEE45_14580 [Candidatus Heimdallarchaeota archaeon B3_Heim]